MADVPTEVSPPAAGTPAPEPATLDSIITGAIEAHSEPAEGSSRLRDERGRFTNSAAPDQAQAQPARAETATTEQLATAQPAPQPLQPPARWSEADKATFAKLPPEGQKILLERHGAMDAEFTRKSQEIAETRRTVEPLVQLTQRWGDYASSLGRSPVQAFDEIMGVEYALRQGTPDQKQAVYALLRDQYGVPISLDGQAPQGHDPRIATLSQTVAQLQAREHQRETEREVSAQRDVDTSLNRFASEKDQSGGLKHPHFERVRQVMGRLVLSGAAQNLEEAYQRAVRLDDELYEADRTAAARKAADEAEKQRAEAVEKARKASLGRGSSPQPRGNVQGGSLDQLLSGAIAKHYGG